MSNRPSEAISHLDREDVWDAVRRHLNGPYHARARMLQLLLRVPAITPGELAAQIDRSTASVRRYLSAVRDGGLHALIPKGRNHSKLDWQQRQELIAEVQLGRFESYTQIVRWVERRFGIRYSVAGMHAYLTAHLDLGRRIVPVPDPDAGVDLAVSPQLTSFLNMLPVTTNRNRWMGRFQDALCVLFPALERGSLTVLLNHSASIEGESRPNVGHSVIEVLEDERGRPRGKSDRRAVDRESEDHRETVLTLMKKAGRDPALFHPPIDFIARLAPNSWVGRIFLFFSIDEPDPRREVELRLELIRPFLTFCLSDGVARDIVRHPQNRPFQLAVDRFSSRYELTPRERQVAALFLSGSSMSEISEGLTIALATVRNHVRHIHDKCGTNRHQELIRLLWEA